MVRINDLHKLMEDKEIDKVQFKYNGWTVNIDHGLGTDKTKIYLRAFKGYEVIDYWDESVKKVFKKFKTAVSTKDVTLSQ